MELNYQEIKDKEPTADSNGQAEKLLKVAIQGVQGAFHEIAARRFHAAADIEVVPADTVAHDFRALRERQVEFLVGRIRMPFADDELSAEILGREGLVIVAGKSNPRTCGSRIVCARCASAPGTELGSVGGRRDRCRRSWRARW